MWNEASAILTARRGKNDGMTSSALLAYKNLVFFLTCYGTTHPGLGTQEDNHNDKSKHWQALRSSSDPTKQYISIDSTYYNGSRNMGICLLGLVLE
jgi:hypothetical protein